MAEVAEMGEVDDIHSKDEGNIMVNGNLNDVDMDTQDSLKESVKLTSETMEVATDNENSETKEISNETESNSDGSEDSNDNTVEESSVATENQTIDNDDATSQETKESEDQGEVEENVGDEQNNVSDDSGSESEKSEDDKSQAEKSDNEGSDNESRSVKDSTQTENGEQGVSTSKEDGKDKDDEEIQEVVDLVDDKDEKKKNDKPIEVHDSGGESDGDGDVMIVEVPKENGTAEVIDLASTPEKQEKEEKVVITPRRSSRNLNKSRSYVEREKEDTPPPKRVTQDESEESDIEEVLPTDPLAVSDSITVERISNVKSKKTTSSTIVVKDTKRLVEIANKSNSNNTSGKKEPTLVIIDTNSILSGRGAVPVNKPAISTSSFTSVLPMALPAQGMYPPNMRATITPIPMNSTTITSSTTAKNSAASITPALPQTPLLPTLTDDMFVVEAPSFIVPYVYEKPPVKDFKDFVKEIKTSLQDKKEKKSKVGDKNEDDKTDNEKDKASKSETDKDDDWDDKMDVDSSDSEKSKKPYSYFNSPLGKFFIDIGFNMVQEFVQSDLLKQQKRKRDREGGSNPETTKNIHSLVKNLEYSKENNEAFRMSIKKCEFCNFKTESALAMAYHLETPHMKNFVYKCNFCSYEIRSPHDILFHMEAEHAVRGHLERAPAFHQCPNCPFEDNQKGKLSRHLVACMRKFKPERNLEPPIDWEPPAKIPRVPKMRQQGLNATAAAYQALSKTSQYQFLSKMNLQSTNALQRGRGRPTLGPNVKQQQVLRPSGMVFKQQTMTGGSVLVPTNYQLSGNQVFQVVGGPDLGGRLGNAGHMAFVPNIPSASSTVTIQNSNQLKKPNNQPSISITPLPRGTTATPTGMSSKPGDTNSKNSFVICEICDGYIKDLEQLRNHMQWIHKIKIHPKMIYNRPPLNCQKCQFRFFTDQGLERHLLGSHGLVTSSMQDAANKSKDSGRCPVCGRVYQWKLLNHVARDHNMTLKPAHLSYKCTVCTATFGMYKQFENHVYSAHSVVAKRVMDKKSTTSSPSSGSKTDLKPLKINDEITIIPQPAKTQNGGTKEGSPASTGSNNSRNSTPSTSKKH